MDKPVRRRLAPLVVRGAVVLSLAIVAGGCAVSVHAPDASSATRKACGALTRALPDRVGDQRTREVDDPERGAAWGDPAIVLTCGSEPGEGFGRASACQETDGIGWYVPESQLGTRPVDVTMTTIGRSPRIQVRVPASYWPPAAVMVDLAPAIKAHTKRTHDCV